MRAKSKKSPLESKLVDSTLSLNEKVDAVIELLKKNVTKGTREGMARYGIPSDKAFGVTVGTMKKLAKSLGRDHELAEGLWDSGWYEARMLASFIDEPCDVTSSQMDRWCREFDSWAICDTVCFHLFDRTPYAWKKVRPWAIRREEFVKRAAFALLWSLTVHDKEADDELFIEGLQLIEQAAIDERHFVKKAVNMALRAIGKRNPSLHEAALSMAQGLAISSNPSAKWIGKGAVRELSSPSVSKRLANPHSK